MREAWRSFARASVDWPVIAAGAALGGLALSALPRLAMHHFPAPASDGPTAATFHDVSVAVPTFAAIVFASAATTAAVARRGSAAATGTLAVLLGYLVVTAPRYVLEHATERDCGTMDGCTPGWQLLVEALGFVAFAAGVVVALALVGATLGATIRDLRRAP